MRRVLGQDARQVPFAGDEHPIGALASYRADPALREGVRSRGLWRRGENVDTGGGEDRVEGRGELRVAIVEQEPEPVGPVPCQNSSHML